MSRRIYYEIIDEEDWTQKIDPHFGSIAVLIFYASLVDPLMGEKMMEASISESVYRYEKNLSEGNIISENDLAHYGVPEMPEMIKFIDDRLLVALRKEKTDIDVVTDMYGGVSNFIDLYYETDYLGYFGIVEDDIVEGHTGYIPNLLDRASELRNFFQRVIDLNRPYKVFVD